MNTDLMRTRTSVEYRTGTPQRVHRVNTFEPSIFALNLGLIDSDES
jgi:hypothetical protein